jgi:hypothetical protein
MNPGPKNSENTAVAFARKKFGNKRTKLQGPQKEKTHTPACICLRHRKPKCHLNAVGPRKPRRILSKTKRGGRAGEEKKAKENATKNHQHYKTQSKSKAQGLSATCSQTYVGRAPLGFTQKSKHAAPRNRGPESSKTRHRGEEK